MTQSVSGEMYFLCLLRFAFFFYPAEEQRRPARAKHKGSLQTPIYISYARKGSPLPAEVFML